MRASRIEIRVGEGILDVHHIPSASLKRHGAPSLNALACTPLGIQVYYGSRSCCQMYVCQPRGSGFRIRGVQSALIGISLTAYAIEKVDTTGIACPEVVNVQLRMS